MPGGGGGQSKPRDSSSDPDTQTKVWIKATSLRRQGGEARQERRSPRRGKRAIGEIRAAARCLLRFCERDETRRRSVKLRTKQGTGRCGAECVRVYFVHGCPEPHYC